MNERRLFDSVHTNNWHYVWIEAAWKARGKQVALWILSPYIDSALYRLHVELRNRHTSEDLISLLMHRASGLPLLRMLDAKVYKNNPYSRAAVITVKNSIAAVAHLDLPRDLAAEVFGFLPVWRVVDWPRITAKHLDEISAMLKECAPGMRVPIVISRRY